MFENSIPAENISDTAEFGGISVNRSKIVDLQGCHPRVSGDPPLKQTWIPTFVGMTIVN